MADAWIDLLDRANHTGQETVADINPESATSGQAIVADGLGSASWETVGDVVGPNGGTAADEITAYDSTTGKALRGTSITVTEVNTAISHAGETSSNPHGVSFDNLNSGDIVALNLLLADGTILVSTSDTGELATLPTEANPDAADLFLMERATDGVKFAVTAANLPGSGTLDAILDSDFTAADGFMRKTGTGAYEAIKSNMNASAPPAITDGADDGYVIGSRWLNTTSGKEYVCFANTNPNLAVWKETTLLGDVVKNGASAAGNIVTWVGLGNDINDSGITATSVSTHIALTDGNPHGVSLGNILAGTLADLEEAAADAGMIFAELEDGQINSLTEVTPVAGADYVLIEDASSTPAFQKRKALWPSTGSTTAQALATTTTDVVINGATVPVQYETLIAGSGGTTATWEKVGPSSIATQANAGTLAFGTGGVPAFLEAGTIGTYLKSNGTGSPLTWDTPGSASGVGTFTFEAVDTGVAAAAGSFRTGNASQTLTTSLRFDSISGETNNVSSILSSVRVGDRLHLRNSTTASNYAIFIVGVAPTVTGGDVLFSTLTHEASSGSSWAGDYQVNAVFTALTSSHTHDYTDINPGFIADFGATLLDSGIGGTNVGEIVLSVDASTVTPPGSPGTPSLPQAILDNLPTGTDGITLKEEANTVTGGPHTTVAFLGAFVTAANVGAGEASVTVAVPDATTSIKGIAELATSAETTAGLVVQASDTRLSDDRPASGIRHTTGVTSVSGATIPAQYETLIAGSGGTTATWEKVGPSSIATQANAGTLAFGTGGVPAFLEAGTIGTYLKSNGTGSPLTWDTPAGGTSSPRDRGLRVLSGTITAGTLITDASFLNYDNLTFADDVEIYINGRLMVGGTDNTTDVYHSAVSGERQAGSFYCSKDLLSGDVIQMFVGGGGIVPDNSVTLAKLEHGAAGDLISYSATAVPTYVAAGAVGEVLVAQGANLPAWTKLNPTTSLESDSGGSYDGKIITWDADGDPVLVGPGGANLPLIGAGAGAPPSFAALPLTGISSSGAADGQVIKYTTGGGIGWGAGGGTAVPSGVWFTRMQVADNTASPAMGMFSIYGSSGTPSGITAIRMSTYKADATDLVSLISSIGPGNILKVNKQGEESEFYFFKITKTSIQGAITYLLATVTPLFGSAGFDFDNASLYDFQVLFGSRANFYDYSNCYSVTLPNNTTDWVTYAATGFSSTTFNTNITSTPTLTYATPGIPLNGTGAVLGYAISGYDSTVGSAVTVRPTLVTKVSNTANSTSLTLNYIHGVNESLPIAATATYYRMSNYALTGVTTFAAGDQLFMLLRNGVATTRSGTLQIIVSFSVAMILPG
jgi:hypothetical protein